MALFQPLSDCLTGPNKDVASLACIGVIMHNIVVVLMVGAAIGVLFMIILGGIKYSLSGGDPKKVSSARGTITWAVVGVTIVFLAFVVLRVLAAITGNTDIINSNVQFPVPTYGAPTSP